MVKKCYLRAVCVFINGLSPQVIEGRIISPHADVRLQGSAIGQRDGRRQSRRTSRSIECRGIFSTIMDLIIVGQPMEIAYLGAQLTTSRPLFIGTEVEINEPHCHQLWIVWVCEELHVLLKY